MGPGTVYGTHKSHFLVTFSLKLGPTILFTHLKIILLQYFRFSVFSFSKINSIQTDPLFYFYYSEDLLFYFYCSKVTQVANWSKNCGIFLFFCPWPFIIYFLNTYKTSHVCKSKLMKWYFFNRSFP